MANIVYANPFGSYVEGASRGQEDAIKEGMAARQFRDSDINADFMRWYAPLRRQEAQTEASQHTLGLNEGLLQNAARIAGTGEFGRNYFNQTGQNIYGQGFGVQARDPVQFQRIVGEASGATPYGVYDPMFAGVGHYGYSKRENLSPQEFEQQMQLRHGPNWQQAVGGAPGAQTPSFNPFEAATGHIFGQAPNTPSQTMPADERELQRTMQQANNPYNPESPLYNRPQQQSQQKSIWADEYQNSASPASGGVNTNGMNPRISSVTGGY